MSSITNLRFSWNVFKLDLVSNPGVLNGMIKRIHYNYVMYYDIVGASNGVINTSVNRGLCDIPFNDSMPASKATPNDLVLLLEKVLPVKDIQARLISIAEANAGGVNAPSSAQWDSLCGLNTITQNYVMYSEIDPANPLNINSSYRS